MGAEEPLIAKSESSLSNKNKELFMSCGIDPSDINPKPLGHGGNHKVFVFNDGLRVIKVPINQHIGTVSSPDEEKINIALYGQYFSQYAVETSFLASPLGYCVVMDYVNGRRVNTNDIVEPARNKSNLTLLGHQLEEIIKDNQRLMVEEGRMLDLVGLEGLVIAMGGLQPINHPVYLTNILVDNGHLRIIDYDLVRIRNLRNPLDVVKATFAFQLNQQVLAYFFNIRYSKRNLT